MSTVARPRYGTFLGSLATALLVVAGAVFLSAWALLVVPFAIIICGGAYQGLALGQMWEGLADGAEDDTGRGSAGMWF